MSNKEAEEHDIVWQMFHRPREWPDSDWHVYTVMKKGGKGPDRNNWVALMFRVKGGAHETMWPDLGKRGNAENAWNYAERLCAPYLH